ncbi:MAG: hypothetical protein LBI40_00765 [Treponema sp.]|nr:hypothetical protein [Treponema sp.]
MSDIYVSVRRFAVSDIYVSTRRFVVSDILVSTRRFVVSDILVSTRRFGCQTLCKRQMFCDSGQIQHTICSYVLSS